MNWRFVISRDKSLYYTGGKRTLLGVSGLRTMIASNWVLKSALHQVQSRIPNFDAGIVGNSFETHRTLSWAHSESVCA